MSLMGEMEADLAFTRQNVDETRKLNEDLEKVVQQLSYENSRLKESLASALRKVDEAEEQRRRSSAQLHSEAEESRQAAAGEIERALGSYRQSAEQLGEAQARADAAAARCEQLEMRAQASDNSVQILQGKLAEARQSAAATARRLEESESYAATLEAALSEINASSS